MASARFRILLVGAVASVAATATPHAVIDLAPANVYFGSLGGYAVDARDSGRLREEFERARIVDGMDFLAVTSPNDVVSVSAIATSLNARLAGRFVAMYGRQYGATGPGGHVNVLEPSEDDNVHMIPDGRYDLFYGSWLPKQKDSTGGSPVVQFAESHDLDIDYGRRDLESLEALKTVTAPYVRTIQIASVSHDGAGHSSASSERWRP
jgi:hypothetical protein